MRWGLCGSIRTSVRLVKQARDVFRITRTPSVRSLNIRKTLPTLRTCCRVVLNVCTKMRSRVRKVCGARARTSWSFLPSFQSPGAAAAPPRRDLKWRQFFIAELNQKKKGEDGWCETVRRRFKGEGVRRLCARLGVWNICGADLESFSFKHRSRNTVCSRYFRGFNSFACSSFRFSVPKNVRLLSWRHFIWQWSGPVRNGNYRQAWTCVLRHSGLLRKIFLS